MISKRCMEDPTEIEIFAKNEVAKMLINDANIPFFVIGHFLGTLRTLQDEIKRIKESINDEIESAEKPEHAEKEWSQGYIAAMKTAQGLLGVSKN